MDVSELKIVTTIVIDGHSYVRESVSYKNRMQVVQEKCPGKFTCHQDIIDWLEEKEEPTYL